MGLFNKIKNMFNGTDNSDKKGSEKQEVVENSTAKISEENNIKVYEKGLTKSRKGFVSRLADLTNKYSKITDEYFDELEEILIMADIGINTVMEFIDRLRDRVRHENITDPSELKEIIVDELFIIYVNDEVLSNKINFNENGPTVILFVGVNGVGKTTTIGKLANKFKDDGKKVLLVGADTFRAGAVSQLEAWAQKLNVKCISGKEKADPSSVLVDGIRYFNDNPVDIIIADTAGRLQNKNNLMNELKKMVKVTTRELNGRDLDIYLTIDATTGQNGLSQAEAFIEGAKVNAVILTKMDGTSKGGIVLSINDKYNLPVKFITYGEQIDDICQFDINQYIDGFIIGG